MAETQNDPRITDQASNEQGDAARDPQGSTSPISRMLANPRRVRRA